MRDFFEIAAWYAAGTAALVALYVGLSAVDYSFRAEPTVNAINEQCGTNYVPMDYLRIGSSAMLQMCETREKRIELKQ